jgi:hypothetical protein
MCHGQKRETALTDLERIKDLENRIKPVPLSFFMATDLLVLKRFLANPHDLYPHEIDLIEQRISHFEAYKAAVEAHRKGGHQCGCKKDKDGGGCQDSGGCGSKKDGDG